MSNTEGFPYFPTRSIITSSGKVLDAVVDDEITLAIERHGEYDATTLTALRDILSVLQPVTSLDIGANIGNHAVVIGDFSQRLVAFEPVLPVFQLLRANLERNLGERALVCNVALSDSNGCLSISVSKEGNLGASSLESVEGSVEATSIQAVVGDEFLEMHGIQSVDFVKIDVEGHEKKALCGLHKTIKSSQPLVMLEWRHPNTIREFLDCRLFDLLFFGYEAMALSSRHNKKLYEKSFAGRLERMYNRMKKDRWCLSDFSPERRYSNVFMIPRRFQTLFGTFPFRKTPCSGNGMK